MWIVSLVLSVQTLMLLEQHAPLGITVLVARQRVPPAQLVTTVLQQTKHPLYVQKARIPLSVPKMLVLIVIQDILAPREVSAHPLQKQNVQKVITVQMVLRLLNVLLELTAT